MRRGIIGATVGTPLNPHKVREIIRSVTSVNGKQADENGNVEIAVSGGSSDVSIDGETLVFAANSTATIENETLIL